MIRDENGLGVMDEAECLHLLGSQQVGRLAVTIGAVPAVFPVNFGVLDDSIVFRTGLGTKLDAATHNSVVAFEVDDVDPVSHEGWSVLVVGVADELTEPALLGRADGLSLVAWPSGAGDHVVCLRAEFISGRRIVQEAETEKAAAV